MTALFQIKRKPFVLLPKEEREEEIKKAKIEYKEAPKPPPGPIVLTRRAKEYLKTRKTEKRKKYELKEKKYPARIEEERRKREETYRIEKAKKATEFREKEEKLLREMPIKQVNKTKYEVNM